METVPEEYLVTLHELNASDVAFFERDLLDHLKGVYALLSQWRVDRDLASAGLFHAVYLTDFFVSHDPNETNRRQIRGVIGEAAERLVYCYCVMDRRAFVGAQQTTGSLAFEDTYSSATVQITQLEDRHLVELIWANSIEQVLRSSSPTEAFKPLITLFEGSQHRVGDEARAAYQTLV